MEGAIGGTIKKRLPRETHNCDEGGYGQTLLFRKERKGVKRAEAGKTIEMEENP